MLQHVRNSEINDGVIFYDKEENLSATLTIALVILRSVTRMILKLTGSNSLSLNLTSSSKQLEITPALTAGY